MSIAVLATCNLNQWAMDFTGNLRRVRESIAKARRRHARYRLGPELEISGYGCEDHFHELDTFTHSWECIAELLTSGDSDDMFLDVGAPVMHRGVSYNCRVLIVNREILLIRPKTDLADHGNYREPRWFRAWDASRPVEVFQLPGEVRSACRNPTGTCAIGSAVVQLQDGYMVGCETCEELWTPHSTHIDLALAGVHIVGNGSASHHVLRKLHTRVELLQSATRKGGGVYLYANQIGCDGGRLYYDGSALVALNGELLAQASQFNLATEVEVVATTVDLSDIVSYRNGLVSRGVQAARLQSARSVHVVTPSTTFSILHAREHCAEVLRPTGVIELSACCPEEEIAKGPACWLWDYLRRSGLNGFFIALSGGADSSSTTAIVGSMCQMLVQEAQSSDVEERLLNDIRTIVRAGDDYIPREASELASRIIHTAYMPSEGASSEETRKRAQRLAEEVGTYHSVVNISGIVKATISTFTRAFGGGFEPRFRTRGGSAMENVALQNVQARIRMLVGYLCAQLMLWTRGRGGSLLVLGSANVDESLRGYLTKYDCSAADINPIGGISKTDLKAFLQWAAQDSISGQGLGYRSLKDVVTAAPTAELEPIEDGYVQTDEQDMGMTYEELCWYGRLRKLSHCGAMSMFRKLCAVWQEKGVQVRDIAQRVKFFFRMYAINRHKLTTLTPSYHAEDYSPEDNRFDLRPFLYNTKWSWQFRRIDEEVEKQQT